MVHRLVYQAFIGDIDYEADQFMVTHKDSDDLNNISATWSPEADMRGELTALFQMTFGFAPS
jgi:hypothetical protein